jgi:hypothetical protein
MRASDPENAVTGQQRRLGDGDEHLAAVPEVVRNGIEVNRY